MYSEEGKMTVNQRFRETMSYGAPDRVPYLEEGIRKDVIKAWYKQGLSPGTQLHDLVSIDKFVEIALDVDPRPAYKRWPEAQDELPFFRERLNPDDPARFPKTWKKKVHLWQRNDQLLFARVHRGFFLTMGVYTWERFSKVMSLLIEDRELVLGLMKLQGAFAAKLLDKMLNDIQIDAAIFSEPIGGNEGPLISPAMYEEFVLESYKPIMAVLDKHVVETRILRTYANAAILIPAVLNTVSIACGPARQIVRLWITGLYAKNTAESCA